MALELLQLSKTYLGQVVIPEWTQQFEPCETVAIYGGNGSGKSTLLNILAGSLFPDRGKVYFQDQEVSRLPDYARSRWTARVFQDPLGGTAPELSILDNFRLAA